MAKAINHSLRFKMFIKRNSLAAEKPQSEIAVCKHAQRQCNDFYPLAPRGHRADQKTDTSQNSLTSALSHSSMQTLCIPASMAQAENDSSWRRQMEFALIGTSAQCVGKADNGVWQPSTEAPAIRGSHAGKPPPAPPWPERTAAARSHAPETAGRQRRDRG